MEKIVLFQPFPLMHREEKIKPFSETKLAIIKMANSSTGSSSLLLRKRAEVNFNHVVQQH